MVQSSLRSPFAEVDMRNRGICPGLCGINTCTALQTPAVPTFAANGCGKTIETVILLPHLVDEIIFCQAIRFNSILHGNGTNIFKHHDTLLMQHGAPLGKCEPIGREKE